MPGMDGIRFLTLLREDFPHIPFIIFTGRGREDVVIEAYEKGADFYLQKGGQPKPLFTELSHKIRAAVDHRQDEERVTIFNRLYTVLSATNKAIVRIRDKKELLAEICRIVVDIGGFSMAWAGMAEPGSHRIVSVASSGHIEGYLDDLDISIEDGPRGSGPSSVAFRTKKHVICNDIATDRQMVPIKQAALQRGFRALAAFPFASDTPDAGVITLYAPVAGFFDSHIIVLLEEMAQDITFAFRTIEEEHQRRRAEDRLQHERNFSMTLIQASPIFYVAISPAGSIILMNEAMLGALGYTAGEVIGKPYLETIVPENERGAVTAIFSRLVTDMDSTVNENHIIKKDGTSRLVEWYGKPVFTPSGEIDFFFGVGIDITGRRLAEEARHATEERYRRLIETTATGYVILDAGGRVLDANAEYIRLSGHSSLAEIRGRSILEWTAEYEKERNLRAVEQCVRDGFIRDFEIDYTDGSGHITPVEINATLLGSGPTLQILTLCRDVSQRRQAQEEARKKDEVYHTLTLNIPGIVYRVFLRENSRMEFYNEELQELTGYTSAELSPGKVCSIEPHILEPDHQEVISTVETAINQHTPFRIEYRFRKKDGEIRTFLERGRPVYDPQGIPEFIDGIIFDVTDQRQLDSRVQESESRYRTLFHTAAEGIVIVDAETREFLQVNPAICTMLGYSEQELTGMRVDQIHPVAELPRVLREFEALSKGEKQLAAEIPLLKKDQSVLYADIATSRLRIGDRQYTVGFFSDVTLRRKQMELLHTEHEFSLRLLNLPTLADVLSFGVNSAIRISRMDGGGIYLVDRNTRSMELMYSTGLSEDFVKTISHLETGSPQAQIVFKKKPVYSRYSDLIDPDSPRMKEGIRAIAIIPILHNDEVIACFNIASHTLTEITGEMRDILETLASQMGNVIARVQAEEAYQASEIRYRRLTEAVTDYIYTVTIDNGKVRETRHGLGCEGVTGYRSEEFEKDPYLWFRMIVEEDRPAVLRQAEEVLAGKDRSSLEHRIIRKDGSIRWVRNTPVSRYDPNGRLIAYDGLIVDITDRRLAEESVKLVNKKLNLLSSITRHDILNQLMALSGVLVMIRKHNPDAPVEKLLEMGERATANITRQIQFTREYQDLGSQAPAWQNVQDRFLSAAKVLPTGSLTLHASTGTLEVYADPLFEKVFYNLIDNALSHAGKITTISLRHQITADGLVIIVEDDGIGVPVAEKQLIFDRGYGKHTGLGLFLSQEILSITGMSIRETGTPGSGARFEIHVPRNAFRIP
jgi:PAS domain S-box-containing protein